MIIDKSTQQESEQRNYAVAIYTDKKTEIITFDDSENMFSKTSNVDKAGKTFPVVALTLPKQVNAPDLIFPYINTRKPTKPYKDVADLICDFEIDLNQIEGLGKKIFEEDKRFQKKEQARAVYALSKILGIYGKYFKDASESQYRSLMQTLRMKFQLGKNSKTTPFHLLSRQYRGNDTKKASSDAKILILADKLEKDENTFSAWIFECKGLNEAKNLSDEHAKEERRSKRLHTSKKSTPKAIFDKLNDSFIDLFRAKQVHRVFTIKKEDMPEFFGAVKPWKGHSVGMIAVDIAGDSMSFYQLLRYVPDHGPYHTEVPNVEDNESKE